MSTSLVAFLSSLQVPRVIQLCFGGRRPRAIQQKYMAATEGETSRVTELLVRMDCNGCVQRIKRALNNIEGVYEIYTDIAQQKLTVIGNADPERILKAIKRTKKTATICPHVEPAELALPISNEQPPSGETPAPEPPSTDEPPKDPEVDPELNKIPELTQTVQEYPHELEQRDSWNHTNPYYWNSMYDNDTRYANSYSHATHSYSTHMPSNYVSEYASEHMPVQGGRYGEVFYGNEYSSRRREKGDSGRVTSMFSDENPNACTIV